MGGQNLRMVCGRVTLCWATDITWVSALGCLIIHCKPNSKANGLAMLKHLFPLFEYRSEATSGESVLGWVTALWVYVHLQGNSWTAVGFRCCITLWGIDPMHCTIHALWILAGRMYAASAPRAGLGPCGGLKQTNKQTNKSFPRAIYFRFFMIWYNGLL
jgi:hypothetical protein